MIVPLIGAVLLVIAIFAAVLAVGLRFGELAAEHTRSGARTSAIDEWGLRGPVLLAARFIGDGMAERRRALEEQLVLAGRPWGGITGDDYLALGLVAIVGTVACFLLLGFLLPLPLAIAFAVVAAVVAFWLWKQILEIEAVQRKENIWREFPFFLDTFGMTMEAGANFNEALTIYANNNTQSSFARDVTNVLNRIQGGASEDDATREMLPAIGVVEIRRSIEVILDAKKEGAGKLLAILRQISDDMRKKRWEDAERASQELRIKLALPTMLIVVALLILVLTPGLVEMGRSGLF